MIGRRARADILQIIILILVIGASLFLLGPMKQQADERARIIRERILGNLEDELGISIRYRTVSPALLSVITIRGLELDFATGSFEADTLRIFYNPLKQLRGDSDDPLRVVSRVMISDGDLVLDIPERPDDEKPAGTGFDADMLRFLEDKTVVLTNIRTDLGISGVENAELEVERLEARYDGQSVRYQVAASGRAAVPSVPTLGTTRVRVESRGRFTSENPALNGRVSLIEADSDLLSLKPMSVDITYSDDELIVRRVADQNPVDISITFIDGRWSVDGETRSMAVSNLVDPAAGTSEYKSWFSSVLDGTFEVSGGGGAGLTYDLAISLDAPDDIEPAGLEAVVVASGNEAKAEVENLLVSAGWGSVGFNGDIDIRDLAPVGLLSLSVSDEIAGYPMNASFRTSYSNGALVAAPVDVRAGDMEFEDFSFLLIHEDRMISASLLAVPKMEGDDGERRIVIDAMADLAGKPVVYGFAAMDGVNASIPLRLAGIDNAGSLPMVRDTRMDFLGSYEANRDSWVLNVDNAALYSVENPENGIVLSGRVFPDRWAMDGMHLSWNDFAADGRLFASRNEDGGTAQGKFLVGEQVIPVDGSWFADGRIHFESEEGIAFSLGPRSSSGRTVLLTTNDLSIPLKEIELQANMDLRGRIVPGDWEVYVNRADLAINRSGMKSVVSAEGTIAPGRILMTRIAVEDSDGLLSGSALLDSASSGQFMNGRIALDSDTGETYEVVVRKERDHWEVKMDIRSALMRRFDPDRFTGTADISGTMTGTISDPTVSLSVLTKEGTLDGGDFAVRANAKLQEQNLRIQDIRYSSEGVSVDRGLVMVDLSAGSLRSTGELNATFNQVPVSSGFSLAADFNRKILLSSINDLLDGDFSGTLATRPVLWDTRQHLPGFTFQFSRQGDTVAVRTPDGKTLNMEHNLTTGILDVTSAAPLPVVVRGGGIIKDGYLDLSFPKMAFDPQLINYVMVRDPLLLEYHVVFQGGMFDGNLDIIGPASDPDMFGTISAVDLKVDTPYTYSDIGTANTDIVIEGNRVTVERIEVPIGDGFVFGEGYITLDRWSLTEFDMVYGGLAGRKGEGVPIYYPLLGVTLDGTFIGECRLKGDGRVFDLTGAFDFPTLKASLSTPLVPVAQRKEGKLPKPFDINLDFRTGNNVKFFLPNEQLKIVQATAEPGSVLNFDFTTVPRTMAITGTIPIKSGSIYYFDRDFQVTEGSLAFNEALGDFDPILDFRAETRVRDDDNDDISVALVYNAPIKSDFNPSVETSPSRTEYEIMELFGQAVVPYAEGETADTNAVLLATTGVFAQAGIVQPFEEVLREGLNLDMVTLRTDIIENTLAEGLGRGDTDVSDLGSGLGRYLDNTSLFAGKYIGDALFVSGSVTADYFEEQRNRSVFGGLEFTTSVSLEMETPFFNVAWSYSPDPAVSRNFVEDNEISLKWQFSF